MKESPAETLRKRRAKDAARQRRWTKSNPVAEARIKARYWAKRLEQLEKEVNTT